MNRRDFFKAAGLIGSSMALGTSLHAEEKRGGSTANAAADDEFVGVLVDTTRCIGCHSCEIACAEAHNLPAPDLSDEALAQTRDTSTTQYTVVNKFETDVGEVFVKKQCMHCDEPACATGCLTKALLKTEEGPVIYRPNKCMGCRFCMVNCPFDIPKFEYDKAIPSIQKCDMCWERQQEGKEPACVEVCPADALQFGKKSELLEIARSRIYAEPDKYVHQIYGEHEAGGTGWLYLSAVPFDQLGFRTDLETTPYPEFTKDFLYGVPIVLTLWPAFLLAVSNATKREDEGE